MGDRTVSVCQGVSPPAGSVKMAKDSEEPVVYADRERYPYSPCP